MDELELLGLWGGCLLLTVVALLFGRNPLLRHTPLPRIHWLLTEGIAAGASAAVQRLGGGRGAAALAAAEELCCERSNPAVQVFFLALFAGCYWVFAWHVFPMLPLPGVPAWHRYTGTAAALVCLALFLAVSWSDPGAVTPANAAAHAALYPHDGVLYPEGKQCRTCCLPRPARSKHCRVCNKCVARLDHHCIWINSCVGLLNMRLFLAFLLATTALCFYAAVLGVRTLRADMALHDTWGVAFRPFGSSDLIYLAKSKRLLLRYLSAAYGPQSAATLFAGMAGWIVAGFTAYQLFLLCRGSTTVEEHMLRQAAAAPTAAEAEVAAARRIEARADAALRGEALPDAALQEELQQRQQQQRGTSRRPYDRGVVRNLAEVLLPHRHLAAAAAAEAAAAGSADDGTGCGPGGKKWA